MIYLDTPASGRAAPKSGLTRVASRLAAELGDRVRPVSWSDAGWRGEAGVPGREDWVLVPGLFSEPERPGLGAVLAAGGARHAAIFHDAIPLKRPDICWAKSVARHPLYMKQLAHFDRVLCVSRASEEELVGYWRWLGIPPRARTSVITLGADLPGAARVTTSEAPTGEPRLLCVGIVEPRKNQGFLLDVCERLWAEGLRFGIDFVGRLNPEFGKPVARALRAARSAGRDVRHLEQLPDAPLLDLYRSATAVVFPTQAEGCGLPLLEALWLGTPCVHSDLPPLLENGRGGGTMAVPLGNAKAWADNLRRLLVDREWALSLRRAACARELPTWSGTADQIVAQLEG